MRYELTDHEWAAIKSMLPNKPRGVARVNDHRVLNGIFWVSRSGAPWRDLPDSFGPYTTCYNRFVRWRRAGVWGKIMNALARDRDGCTDDRHVHCPRASARCLHHSEQKTINGAITRGVNEQDSRGRRYQWASVAARADSR
jgi:transposase